MRDWPYSLAAVRAEVKRAKRFGRNIDRGRLLRETGITRNELESAISEIVLELLAATGRIPFLPEAGGEGAAHGHTPQAVTSPL